MIKIKNKKINDEDEMSCSHLNLSVKISTHKRHFIYLIFFLPALWSFSLFDSSFVDPFVLFFHFMYILISTLSIHSIRPKKKILCARPHRPTTTPQINYRLKYEFPSKNNANSRKLYLKKMWREKNRFSGWHISGLNAGPKIT